MDDTPANTPLEPAERDLLTLLAAGAAAFSIPDTPCVCVQGSRIHGLWSKTTVQKLRHVGYIDEQNIITELGRTALGL